jgi:tryptophanyl-tRNA synthetase
MSQSRKIMLSAMQPTSKLTLGNYLGALRNWVSLQDNYDCIFFAVDLHAITLRQDPEELRENTLYNIATYIAAGIDPKKALFFAQSHVSEHAELAWVLNCFTYMGELGRMTQYKDKSSKQGENISVGLFDYPVLMASDILLYDTDLVPVGADQKQHVELTRDVAIRFNNTYRKGKDGPDILTVPEPFIPPVGARIMSLQDPTSKMSKSDPDANATVFLSDPKDTIIKKFKRAVTDSGTEITFEDSKPGVKNLLSIQSALTGKPPQELVATYQGKMYGHLKVDTAEIVAAAIEPIQTRARELMQNRAELEKILADGAQRARAKARKTLDAVYDAVGFLPRR